MSCIKQVMTIISKLENDDDIKSQRLTTDDTKGEQMTMVFEIE